MPALGASGSVNACVIFNIAANPFSTVLIWGLVPVPAFLLGVLWVWSDVSGALVRTLAGCMHMPSLQLCTFKAESACTMQRLQERAALGMQGGGSGAGQPSIGYTAHLGGALTGALTWVAYSRGRLRL
jgi:membrane associated rhomboid family serine protease